MPNDTITLALDGNPNLKDFEVATSALSKLVDRIAKHVGAREVEWMIEGLDKGSAMVTVRGEASPASDPDLVERVTGAYLIVGQALESHRPIPYPITIQRATDPLVHLLNGRVPAIRFQTADADAVVHAEHAAPPTEAPKALISLGAVEGIVQTLSSRKGLRFTLYDALFDRPVSCYLTEGSEDLMRDAWGRRAIIEGRVSRDPESGRPISIRRITDAQIVSDHPSGAFRLARGIRPLRDGDPLPEESIRLLRDAE